MKSQEKAGGPPPNRDGKLDRDVREIKRRGRRFARRAARRAFTGQRRHRVTPEALASGEVEARLARRLGVLELSSPPRYLSLPDFLVSRGWTRSYAQARRWLRQGKVNIYQAGHWETWSYPDVPIKDLEYDDRGLPRIMVEGERDPRRTS